MLLGPDLLDNSLLLFDKPAGRPGALESPEELEHRVADVGESVWAQPREVALVEVMLLERRHDTQRAELRRREKKQEGNCDRKHLGVSQRERAVGDRKRKRTVVLPGPRRSQGKERKERGALGPASAEVGGGASYAAMNSGGGRKTPYRRSTGHKWHHREQQTEKGSNTNAVMTTRNNTRRRLMEIRYINLEKRPERRVDVERRLREAGLDACATRFRAVTGHETPESLVLLEWDSRLNSRYDKTTLPHPRVPMTVGERGCAMSHACLWASCASRPDDSWPLVVLEDDVEFAPDIAIHLSRVVAKVEETFSHRNIIVYLGADVASWSEETLNQTQRKSRLKAESNAFFQPATNSEEEEYARCIKLLSANYVWQTSSYVIWPAAAKKLVSSLPVAEPVDNFISKQLLQGKLNALVCIPFLARQVAAYCDGDIRHSRPTVACPRGDKHATPLAPIW